MFRASILALSAAASLAALVGCASTSNDEITEVPSADRLYEEGVAMLGEESSLLGLNFTNYQD
ncbi:MAG TPA: hypothetical protein VFT98_20335, partial [Myxococcota bacterium]|nr:hypothetical protein [Myxococcota bacterium]